MKERVKHYFAQLIDSFLYFIGVLITGIHTKSPQQLNFSPARKVYYANHNSHGDFILVWISLPKRWRMQARPVAAADYWQKTPLRRFIIHHVFNGLLVERKSMHRMQAIDDMGDALQQQQSLIIFPEGTRNTTDDIVLQTFKSGIFHLAQKDNNIEFVPVWINNMNRVLPKGHFLPVPLLCEVAIGKPLRYQEGESKQAFLQRSREALLTLSPDYVTPSQAEIESS